MSTLAQLQEKYPGTRFNYEPFEDCPRCHGTGEYMNGLGKMGFCFCLFVDHNPEFLQIMHDVFNGMARDYRNSRKTK